MRQAALLVLPPLCCRRYGQHVLLDRNFVTAMSLYCRYWEGPVRCLIRDDPALASPDSDIFTPTDLPFRLDILPPNGAIGREHLVGSDLVFAAGDGFTQMRVSILGRQLGIPCVYGVEESLEARLQMLLAETENWGRLARSMLWALVAEWSRRRALLRANALQANGVAAHRAYSAFTPDNLLFFDNRLDAALLASEADMQAAEMRRQAGAPLRLVYFGRLERPDGAHHLVPLMTRLAALGLNVTLDVYGVGSLADEINHDLAWAGLHDRMTLHGPVDFETELVPKLRGTYDLFVCCRRQSDPSCTYVETLGCGIPIVGYGNQALTGMLELVDAGWSVRPGDTVALARAILRLDAARDEIDRKARAGLVFARANISPSVFEARVRHLKRQLLPEVRPGRVRLHTVMAK